MSTWSEDVRHSLETLHLPHPGDLGPKDAFELVNNLAEGILISGKGSTVAEALTAAGKVPVLGAVAPLAASFYLGALVGAVLYASANQAWDEITAPIDLRKMLELARKWEAPIIELPATEEVDWYPKAATAHETTPDRPEYPGREIKRNSTDADNVELIQQNLKSAGYELKVDHVFGPETDRIVRQFQKDHALKVDGIVGSSTWKILFGI